MREDDGVDLDTFTWLLGDDGQRLLDRAAHLYADLDGDPLAAAAAVRKVEPDAERAAAKQASGSRGGFLAKLLGR